MLLLLLACSSEIQVTPGQSACVDVDFQDPDPSTLEWESTGEGAARVWRTYVFLDQSGLTFTPDLGIEKGVLTVNERWEEPETDDAFCYQPELEITDFRGVLEVRWFTEDDDTVPFATVQLE